MSWANAKLDGERHELLLGAVMQVAFQPAALRIPGGHHALARGCGSSAMRRTLRSTSPAWSARSASNFSRVGIQVIARRDAHRERAEELAVVADGERAVSAWQGRQGSVGLRERDGLVLPSHDRASARQAK